MAYVSPKFDIGETAFFYDADSDTVQRVKVTGIRAECAGSRFDTKWKIVYTVRDEWARDPRAGDATIGEDDLHSSAHSAFPPIPPEPASVDQAAVEVL